MSESIIPQHIKTALFTQWYAKSHNCFVPAEFCFGVIIFCCWRISMETSHHLSSWHNSINSSTVSKLFIDLIAQSVKSNITVNKL